MIRPVSTPLDLWLVRSIQHKGIGLGPGGEDWAPFNRAMVSFVLFPVAEEYVATYVMHETRDGRLLQGFIQTWKDLEREGVQVVFLSPAPAYEDSAHLIWSGLLEYASLRLANLSVKRIFADVPVGEEQPFRKVGFTAYTQEDLYLLEEQPSGLPDPVGWQLATPEDKWEVQRLYNIITPPPVQKMESKLALLEGDDGFLTRFIRKREEWLIRDGGDVKSYCCITRIGKVTYLRLMVHPELTSESDKLVGTALALSSLRRPPPYAIKVRNYEGGIRGALERWGFRHYRSFSLMVRHTLAFEGQKAENLKPLKEMPVGILPIKSLQSGRATGVER